MTCYAFLVIYIFFEIFLFLQCGVLQANFGQAFTQNLVKNAGGGSNDSGGNKDDPVAVKKAGNITSNLNVHRGKLESSGFDDSRSCHYILFQTETMKKGSSFC